MKRMLLAVLSAFCLHATAQITVTAATFPAVGDTLMYAIDNDVADVALAVSAPGGPKMWDFSNLQADEKSESVLKPR